MAQLITVRLNKSDQQPLGFRLQGGKDFGTPLVVQKVNGGSAAERAGLQAGDALIRVNNTDVYTLRHQEAQDAIRLAGQALELTVQRGGGTWRPSVTPTGSLPRPGSRALGATPTPVTSTSLKANQQPSRAFGSGHNNVAKPFGYMNGNDSVKSIVNKQYNTPVNMYSDKTIAETLSAQTEVLAGGVLGVNFKKNEKTYDAEKSAVFKVLQEAENDPEPVEVCPGAAPPPPAVAGLRPVAAPVTRPDAPVNNTGGLPPGQNICEECERLITGVFVRIKDKNLHVECFKCATCGSSLKNQGYYNLNGKLYCDIHAKLVARQHPPAPHLEPVTVPPGGRLPTNAYSTPLPPLATNNYTNGSSSMFSPSSNLSGPKPFGSSIGSAYSPSLSPRSAPMSPARPVTAPAPAHAPAPAPAPVAPFAPILDSQSVSSPQKTDFKSPAEERLIRKMAKMALNGYEIGIQRKIKPADHIQSMADKIQDTVVTKHPLNADGSSSGENSRDSTLKHPLNKTFEKGYKTQDSIQSLGDKIKETIINNHPMTINFSNGNVPVPPPIPKSPIPTFNAHSTPIPPPMNINVNNNIKQTDYIPKNLNNSFATDTLNKTEKSLNGSGYSSSEDYKEKPENNISVSNTLRKKAGFEKTSFLNGMNSFNNDTYKPEIKLDSNTLNKKKIFENKDAMNGLNNYADKVNKFNDKNNVTDLNISIKNNSIEKSFNEGNSKTIINDDDYSQKQSLPHNMCDNSLYTYKSVKNDNNTTINSNESVNSKTINRSETEFTNGSEKQDDDESEVVVKRRQKKNTRNDDGRRDSHIIARPLSTMTSVDVTDGMYPVCHKCDKAITRGPFITALGRIWCPEHFICVNATCRRPLQDIGFVEENGQLYCEYCFEQYIAPACDKCHAKIKGDCLNAIGKHFHPECFNCVYCGKLFGNNPFFLEDGLPYCESDWNELFTTKCFACGFPVEAGDRWVEALNNNYHSQCFNCTVCKKNLEGQSFFAKGGRPFCKTHAR
ncbi:PDZ and LIM domain protein Zasp isoform X5 [Ostrinia furnacalis]|uniref:PDZ and LIM domain protein Zasp isoform X3 n=1 Tax=Ostrinia furnacalis TaxID=93504 RepID=UPI00103EB0E5|nr:PDZ and LIM domain protein Zasp isoform X3 [Ostrinia furnacalis]XP_028161561.1 PDZ and LIM domain protein Zasp isoform X5 [Ostrinia furnacalis]